MEHNFLNPISYVQADEFKLANL